MQLRKLRKKSELHKEESKTVTNNKRTVSTLMSHYGTVLFYCKRIIKHKKLWHNPIDYATVIIMY